MSRRVSWVRPLGYPFFKRSEPVTAESASCGLRFLSWSLTEMVNVIPPPLTTYNGYSIWQIGKTTTTTTTTQNRMFYCDGNFFRNLARTINPLPRASILMRNVTSPVSRFWNYHPSARSQPWRIILLFSPTVLYYWRDRAVTHMAFFLCQGALTNLILDELKAD